MKLDWVQKILNGNTYWEAKTSIGRFTLSFQPTNNIRGPWSLLIQRNNDFVPNDNRYYHDLENAKEEAGLIAAAVMAAEKLYAK